MVVCMYELCNVWLYECMGLLCLGVCMYGLCKVLVCVCIYFLMSGCMYVWVI